MESHLLHHRGGVEVWVLSAGAQELQRQRAAASGAAMALQETQCAEELNICAIQE